MTPSRWIGLAGLALACVSDPQWEAAGMRWDRDDTTYQQFEVDRAACDSTEQDMARCLQARGYYPWASRNRYDRVRETLPTR